MENMCSGSREMTFVPGGIAVMPSAMALYVGYPPGLKPKLCGGDLVFYVAYRALRQVGLGSGKPAVGGVLRAGEGHLAVLRRGGEPLERYRGAWRVL